MNNILKNAAAIFNAVAYYIASAISLVVSNKYFLGATVLLILTAGKSFSIGRIVKAKG